MSRRAGLPGLLLGALLISLSACAGAPRPEVPVDAVRPDRSWWPDGEVRALLLAVHGFNDYSRAFEGFGGFAAERGIAVVAYDQRGFGANPDAGFWPGTGVLVAELKDKLERLQSEHPDVPLFVLGESMGAAVVTVALSEIPEIADGTILTAPAVWGGDQLNPLYRAVLWSMNQVAPGYRLTGEQLDVYPTDNSDILIELGRDPLVIKATRVDAIAGLVDLMDLAVERVPQVPGPLLVLMGEQDEIVPPRSQEVMVARLEAQPCTAVNYPKGYHMLLRDLQRKVVWQDVLAWIEGADVLPSGLQDRCGADIRTAEDDASRSGS